MGVGGEGGWGGVGVKGGVEEIIMPLQYVVLHVSSLLTCASLITQLKLVAVACQVMSEI